MKNKKMIDKNMMLEKIICVLIISVVLVFLLCSNIYAKSDAVIDFYEKYVVCWNNEDIDYKSITLDSIASKLKNDGWKFYSGEAPSQYENNNSLWTDSIVTKVEGSQMEAGFFTDNNSNPVYSLRFTYWVPGPSHQLEIYCDSDESLISKNKTAVGDYFPTKIVDLLGQKSREDLGFTDNYLSRLRNGASYYDNDLFSVTGFGKGIDFVEFYFSSDKKHFSMRIFAEDFNCKIGSNGADGIINYMCVEFIN